MTLRVLVICDVCAAAVSSDRADELGWLFITNDSVVGVRGRYIVDPDGDALPIGGDFCSPACLHTAIGWALARMRVRDWPGMPAAPALPPDSVSESLVRVCGLERAQDLGFICRCELPAGHLGAHRCRCRKVWTPEDDAQERVS